MHRFSVELQYHPFTLSAPRHIAVTSFFSHKTVSYLDLAISKRDSYRRTTQVRRPMYSHVTGTPLLPFNRWPQVHTMLKKRYFSDRTFFCTEESFRNYLVPKRRLLYSLNLDFAAGRELSFKNGPTPVYLPRNNESLFVAVKSNKWFYEFELARLAELALKKTNSKLKLLRWMAHFRPLDSAFISLYVQQSLVMILYRECVDTELLVKCFGKLIGIDALISVTEPEVLECFLYKARLSDFDARSELSCASSLSDYCIVKLRFNSVSSFLKYEHTVYYTEESYEKYKRDTFHGIRVEHREEMMSLSEGFMSKLRLYRILQILFILEHQRPLDTSELFSSETLRFVWRSIPDSYVSLQEMRDAYQHVFTAQLIGEAHSLYEVAIGQTVPRPEPRRLTHYCRTVVRKTLYDAKKWLPEGIEQLKLPPRIESFLNLQRDNLQPEKLQNVSPADEIFEENLLGI